MVEIEKRKPLISVIMPVYNSEDFLHLAVESVMKQTLTDWELLLIDDGSSDKSGALCDNYARRDKRIRVFHQKNCGITKTRNRGITEASGTYLTFIDNDDEFMPDILSKTCALAEEYKADVVKFGYHVEEDYPGGIKLHRDSCADQMMVLTENNLDKMYYAVRNSGYFNMIWNGIYRTSLFEKKALMFDESVIMGYEDWIFNNNMYMIPKCQIVLNEIGYVHYQRFSHSTSKKFHPNQLEAVVKAAETEHRLLSMLNEKYHADFKWTARALDYLIDFLSIFERRGCSYSFLQQRKALKWVRSRKIFMQLSENDEIGKLSGQRKLFLILFKRKQYNTLLILSKFYFRYILWKEKHK